MKEIKRYKNSQYYLLIEDEEEKEILMDVDISEIDKVFGEGIVKRAFKQVANWYMDETFEEVKERINFNQILDCVNLEEDLFVEFVNDTIIRISVSEWGDIERLK